MLPAAQEIERRDKMFDSNVTLKLLDGRSLDVAVHDAMLIMDLRTAALERLVRAGYAGSPPRFIFGGRDLATVTPDMYACNHGLWMGATVHVIRPPQP